MSDLKNRTARASHFVISESVQNLRLLAKQLDQPATVDRVLAESEIISGALKKLSKILEADAQENKAPSPKADTANEVCPSSVNFWLGIASAGRLCETCGGFKPRMTD